MATELKRNKLVIAPYGFDKDHKAFPPNPTQQKILDWIDRIRDLPDEKRDHIFVLYLQGGVGSGKSRGIMAGVIELLLEIPMIRILWGRSDFKDIKLSIMDKFFEVLPQELIQDQSKQYNWYDYKQQGRKSYGRIFFNGLKDLSGLGSQEFAVIAVTETLEITEQIYRALKRRCRQAGMINLILMEGEAPNDDHWLADVTNPNSSSYDPDIEIWNVSTYENWDNLPLAYRGSLESMPESWKKKYLLGQFGFKPDGKPFYDGFSLKLHKAELNAITERPVIRSWDYGFHFPACYDRETQVLTKEGWKYFKDVSDKEIVMTFNPQNASLEYQQIYGKIEYDFKGEMYHWHQRGNIQCDIRVTDNHFMVGYNGYRKEFLFKQAYQFKNRKDRFKCPTSGKWKGEGQVASIDIPFNLFCEFMGLWLSEGSLSFGNSRKGKEHGLRHYNIWIWQKINELCINKLLDRMPCKFSRQKHGGWVAGSKSIALYLKQFGHSGDKFVPQEIKDSPVENIKQFLKWYEFGDGSKAKRKNREGTYYNLVTTKSKRMADDLQELYLKIGISSMIHKDKKGCYQVRKNVNYLMGLKAKHLTVEKVDKERVYCVAVSNKTLIIRRHGRAIVSGNCSFHQINAEGRWVILREHMGRDITIDKYGEYIKTMSREWFPDCRFDDVGDPAGEQVSDKSEKTSVQILASLGIVVNSRTSTYRERKEIIERKFSTLINKRPALLINSSCKTIIDGLLGGYHYPIRKATQAYNPAVFEIPFKDGYYEHLINTVEYFAVNTFTGAETKVDNTRMIPKVVGPMKDVHIEVEEDDDSNYGKYTQASRGGFFG